MRWLEKPAAPRLLGLGKRFQRKVLASNSFQCWHCPCGSNCVTFSISELSSPRRRLGDRCVGWLEKRGGPRLLGLGKRFQGKALASNSFQCWHFPCGSNCWTFSISELSSPRRRDGDHCVRWLEKRGAPRLLGLGKRFQGKALASNSFQCWHFACGSNCWTFAISQLVSTRWSDHDRDVR